MKTIPALMVVAGLTGGWLAGTSALAADNPAPVDVPANTNADFPPGEGLRINFKNVPLQDVLNYMSKAGGFIIHPEVSIMGDVTAYSDQPMSKEDALTLVENVLGEKGYSVIRQDRILTIVSSRDAQHRELPVVKYTSLAEIPKNAEMATYIIPVRTLNPIALLNNLAPLIGTQVNLQANESANSLLVTGSQNDIRRVADIVMKLDSVSSSINTIEVFPLKYADAKATADLVKQLYPSQDQGARGGAGGGGGIAQIAGFFGAPAASGNASGSTPGTKVTATSDDHSNALIVSAPEGIIPTIRELVEKLDVPVEDVTEVHVFHLTNADATEMVATLGNVFPSTSSSADASQSAFQFGGLGGFGGAIPGAPATASTGPSQYMKKVGSVVAVADQRTQSLVVSASKDLMPQIEDMVNELDTSKAGKVNVYRIALHNADPADVQQIISDLFPQGNNTTRTTTQNPLQTRATTVQQNMTSSGVGSGNATSASSGPTGGRGN